MYFFGVTTAQSSSRKMFPVWMDILGTQGELVGVDFVPNAPAEEYRRAVQHLKDDPLALGALVTTHKINVFQAAGDLFDEHSEDARLCGEVSCIYKRDGRLIAHAVDPVTSARSMAAFIPAGWWREHRADVLCLGAGGSAMAITTHFVRGAPPDDRPRRIVLVNRSAGKLDAVRALVAQFPHCGIAFEYVQNADPARNDALMADLPPASMVINATGMGKDTPGSPVTDAGLFPLGGIVWELNYRGDLLFLRQALAQRETRRLLVEDGWRYFIEGWAEIVCTVFDVPLTPERFTRLAQAAEAIR